jgi:uncharacterized membrane protein
MIVYHFSWDLTVFGLADFGVFTDPAWIWFAYVIVIIILGVMGISQVMARRRGLTLKAVSRRFALIAGSAGAVSLATYLMDPGSYVFFGILHHIALASILIAGALYLASPVLVVLAAAIVAAPEYLAHPVFAADWLLWVGLAPVTPESVDYVPLVPWLGVPLLGVVAGRWMFRSGSVPAVLAWRPAHPITRLIRLAGRHSLALYLIHQPVLYGGLYLFMGLYHRSLT